MVSGVGLSGAIEEEGEDVRDCSGEGGAEHDCLAPGHEDGMVQGFRPEIVVYEGGNGAHLGEPQPGAHKLWSVLHEHGHCVTLGEALCEEVVSHSVAVLLNLLKCPLLVLVVEKHLVRASLDRAIEHLGHCEVPHLRQLCAHHELHHLLDGPEVPG